MVLRFVIFINLLILISCTMGEDIPVQEEWRWMERDIYFALSDINDPNRNNAFQKEKVKDALREIEDLTLLGRNYFSFYEINETELNVNLEAGTYTGNPVSFILIWPDEVFDLYLQDNGGDYPDQNAFAVINAAYKRQFFIIFKASCFEKNASCSEISTEGFRALVARQLGSIVGLSYADCDQYPTDVMCSSPSDGQWSLDNKLKYASQLNNYLELIRNTKGFYERN